MLRKQGKHDVSRTLSLNEWHISHEFLKVDEYRIRHLREMLWEGVDKFCRKIFK